MVINHITNWEPILQVGGGFKHFLFSKPICGVSWSNLTSICFKMGWGTNHQHVQNFPKNLDEMFTMASSLWAGTWDRLLNHPKLHTFQVQGRTWIFTCQKVGSPFLLVDFLVEKNGPDLKKSVKWADMPNNCPFWCFSLFHFEAKGRIHTVWFEALNNPPLFQSVKLGWRPSMSRGNFMVIQFHQCNWKKIQCLRR